MNARRGFLKKGLGVAVAMLAAKIALFTDSTAAAASKKKGKGADKKGAAGGCDKPIVDLNDGSAKAVKYVHTHENADPSIKMVRQGREFKDQLCSNCMFYTASGECEGHKVGKCMLIKPTEVVVRATGICGSWAPKA